LLADFSKDMFLIICVVNNRQLTSQHKKKEERKEEVMKERKQLAQPGNSRLDSTLCDSKISEYISVVYTE